MGFFSGEDTETYRSLFSYGAKTGNPIVSEDSNDDAIEIVSVTRGSRDPFAF